MRDSGGCRTGLPGKGSSAPHRDAVLSSSLVRREERDRVSSLVLLGQPATSLWLRRSAVRAIRLTMRRQIGA